MLITPVARQWAGLIDRMGTAPLVRLTHGLINRATMAADVTTIVIAAVALHRRLFEVPPCLSIRQVLVVALLAALGFCQSMRWAGLYRVERYARPWASLRDLLRGYLPALAAGWLPIWAFAPSLPARSGWLLLWAGGVFLCLIAERQVVRRLVRVVEARAMLRRRVAIIGISQAAEELVREIDDPAIAHDYELVGIFDDRMDDRRPTMVAGHLMAGTIDDLVGYAQHNPIDTIVVALPWSSSTAVFRLIEKVQWIAADIVVPFEKTGFRLQSARLVELAGSSALQVMYRPFKGMQGLLKVVEDYTVGAIGLVVASPVLLLAALAVRLDNPGPVLFRQARVGFNGRPFMIYKFRTMTVDPNDDGSVGTDKHNPRITRVGAILRRTSIDEIPQLLNVMRGEMSVVGPRPHVPKMLVGDECYTDAVRRYASRHRIKPGITGWAQINGMRGGIHSVAKAERGVELDLQYIANWSCRLDLRIMLRTLVIGMTGRDVF